MMGAEWGPPREPVLEPAESILNLVTEARHLKDQVATLAAEKNETNDENCQLRAQIVRDEEYLAFLTASDHVHKESVHLIENYRNGIKADNPGLFS